MKFSVILPIYKVEKYLPACVDSILNQTFKDFEVILVDDGSPDNCPGICDEYARQDSRIKVIHKKNGGLSDARNVGLEMASGEYICFIDSDDYLIDCNVLQLLADKSKNKPDVIHYKFKQWYEHDGHVSECNFDYNIPTEERTVADIYCELIDRDAYHNSAWSKIIRRDFLLKNHIQFEKGILGEDNEWFYHVVMAAQNISFIDEPLYIYRKRAGSITKTVTRKNLVDLLYVIEKWENILDTKKNDPRSTVIFNNLAKQYCSVLIIYSNIQDADDLYSKIIEKSYLLQNSKTKRVKIFRITKKIIGLKGLIRCLKLMQKYR